MPRKRSEREPISFPERLRRIREAGLGTRQLQGAMSAADRTLPDLEERVRRIQAFLTREPGQISTGMLFFVMYDIEDHKIRRHIAKYLQRQGCMRMQKSVFIGNLPHKKYREIADTLEEVNSMYANGDSLLVLPITQETIAQLQVIGKDLNYKMVTSPPNILII
jgi:CRISPR-associated endonuclease Cas2